MAVKRKLIEVALPLDAINAAAAREKSIRHGHPSTLHLWWARRPLAACRAVLFASLVDDPSCDEALTPDEQEVKRKELFGLVEQLVQWDNSNDALLLAEAHQEIMKSTGGGGLPAILDPFAGGGSIPLEAQHLGLDVYASDLNPVAVLINKALIEIPPRFAGRPPIHAGSRVNALDSWSGAQGLAADVRHYGHWMREQAQKRIGHLYPTVALPAEHGGEEAAVIAWIWARTVRCPNPACGSTMPLLNSYALSRRKNREAWLQAEPDRDAKRIRFQIRQGPGCPQGGTVGRGGAVCLACGSGMPLKDVRAVAKAGGLGSQLVSIVAEGDRRRVYLPADDAHVDAALMEPPCDPPFGSLPKKALGFRVQQYGLTEWADLFTARQLTTMCTFADLVAAAREQVLADGGDEPYANAVALYLSLTIGRLANRSSNLSFWNPNGDKIEQVFARNALPMIWVYAEGNPFSNSSGNFLGQLEYLVAALERVPAAGNGSARQLDARSSHGIESKVLVCTDPPYYDNVPYADLSDFFYVWLRRCLKDTYEDLCSTLLVPKAQELIAEPARQGDWDSAAAFFEDGLKQAFTAIVDIQDEAYPFIVFYAFKQAEDTGDGNGRVSTGWETMLEGLLDSGVTITGTWPVRTEQPGGLRVVGRAALASSIVLVCRRRSADAPLTTRRDFLSSLHAELPEALRLMQQGNIAPVDLAQASIGPGMAIFSRYSRVVEADGGSMSVRDALAAINQALDVVLAEQEAEFDADTRWAIAWHSEYGFDEGSAGTAETLSKAKNTSIEGLVRAGILHQQGNACRLLARSELNEDWSPETDERLTVWEIVHHLIHRLENEGESAAGDLMRAIGGLAEPARELAYRLYHTCERKGWTADALAYNGLVAAWPELSRLADKAPEGQGSLGLMP